MGRIEGLAKQAQIVESGGFRYPSVGDLFQAAVDRATRADPQTETPGHIHRTAFADKGPAAQGSHTVLAAQQERVQG
jgi:hypothetical protein